jgi:hypothetical protein
MTTARSAAARELARRLMSQETAAATEPQVVAAAMQRVCTRVSTNLRRSVGDDGYNALLVRAVASIEGEHPVVAGIRRTDGSAIHLEGILAAVDASGAPAVGAALEALLAALIDILASLIGADMVPNLLGADGPSSPPLRGTETP